MADDFDDHGDDGFEDESLSASDMSASDEVIVDGAIADGAIAGEVIAAGALAPVAAVLAPLVVGPRPRVWSALVVGVFVIPVAMVVATVILVGAAIADGGLEIFRGPDRFQAYLEAMLTTRRGFFLLVLPGQMVFVTAALGAAAVSPMSIPRRLGLVRGTMPWRAWPAFMLATPMVALVTMLLMPKLMQEPGEQVRLIEKMFSSHTGPFAVVVLLMLSVLPGLCEEMLFRGYLQSRLLARWHPVAAIGVTAVIFAMAHVDPRHALIVLPLGVWLGVVAWRCGSIWPAVLCHATNNALSIVASWAQGDKANTIELNAPDVAVILVSAAAMAVSIVYMVRYGRPRRRDGDAIE